MSKFYVVWSGRCPGVYTTWVDCQKQISGFNKARFKSYKTREQAEAAYAGYPLLPMDLGPTESALTVDGACSGTTGEYRGVLLPSKRQVFRHGPYDHATNNVMEYLAILRGFQWLHNLGVRFPIYSDSNTAMTWIKRTGHAHNSTHAIPENAPLAREIFALHRWFVNLANRLDMLSRLRKWDTNFCGEIPADFNRK